MLTLEVMTRQPLLPSTGPPFQSLYEAAHCATLTLAMVLAPKFSQFIYPIYWIATLLGENIQNGKIQFLLPNIFSEREKQSLDSQALLVSNPN